MSMPNMRKALNSYSQSSLDVVVESASPHRLICLLFDGAIQATLLARMHMQNGQIPEKGAAISKAISIVEEGLRLSLDKTGTAEELAGNLDSLYEYISVRLLMANINNDLAMLDEVHGLLSQLRDAWQSIEQKQDAGAAVTGDVADDKRSAQSYGRA